MTRPTSQGVLALGDSITNGGGELQWGVALQSWAQWVARGLGLPYTGHAIDGATVRTVLDVQIPRAQVHSARPEAGFDLGCLYMGVNDVRATRWDADAYAAGLGSVVGWLDERCERTLVCTLPLDLGRPRAGGRVAEANTIVAAVAARHTALVVDLSDFGARNHVMVDHVHPTAFGQIAIAERALGVLAANGLTTRVRPSTLVAWETTRLRRLRGDCTYAYRHMKVSARAALARIG